MGVAELVEDALPEGGINPGPGSSHPSDLTNVKGNLYFVANDGSSGAELWWINQGVAELVGSSTAGGGINPGLAGAVPRNLTEVDGALYFSADDGLSTGRELWYASPTFAVTKFADTNDGSTIAAMVPRGTISAAPRGLSDADRPGVAAPSPTRIMASARALLRFDRIMVVLALPAGGHDRQDLPVTGYRLARRSG